LANEQKKQLAIGKKATSKREMSKEQKAKKAKSNWQTSKKSNWQLAKKQPAKGK